MTSWNRLSKNLVWSMTWCILIGLSSGNPCTNESCVACGSKEDPLILECESGYVVSGIVLAGIGDDNGECVYTREDCLDEPTGTLPKIIECMWKKNSCSLTFPPWGDFAKTDSCGRTRKCKYLTIVNHTCVPELDVHSICVSQATSLQAEEGIEKEIITPGMMDPYAQYKGSDYNSSLCSLTIKSINSNYGIRLRSVYMNVRDDIIIGMVNESDARVVWNGDQQRELYWPNSEMRLEFHFELATTNGNIGFALRYTSYPLTSNPTETIPIRPGTSPVVSTSPNLPSTTTPGDSTTERENRPTPGWITAVIFTSLACIIMAVLAVTILIICQNRSRHDSHNIDNGSLPDTINTTHKVDEWVKKNDFDQDSTFTDLSTVTVGGESY